MWKTWIVPFSVVVSALLFLDPWHLLMPTMLQYTLLGGLAITVSLYGVILFQEELHDERDQQIRALSHRVALLTGMIGLVTIIGYYLITKGMVYPELIVLLVVMVCTKTIARYYGERYL